MINARTVEPAKPAAAYIGGKRLLAKTIIRKINQTPHTAYAEPFVGMGGVFLRRDKAPRLEVINDINGEVVNLFRILQRHYPQFIETLRFQVASRQEFERLACSNPVTLTDLERAARFLYLQRLAFGGKVRGQTFGVSMDGSRFNLLKLAPQLEEIHERMAGVVIENLPWQAFISRYDRHETLFYLDPPYWGSEDYYGKELFGRADFTAMADLLSSIKGRFILSLNAVKGVFETFSAFNIEEVDCTYSIASANPKSVREVIISNAD